MTIKELKELLNKYPDDLEILDQECHPLKESDFTLLVLARKLWRKGWRDQKEYKKRVLENETDSLQEGEEMKKYLLIGTGY